MSIPSVSISAFKLRNSGTNYSFPSNILETGSQKYMSFQVSYKQKAVRLDEPTTTPLSKVILPIPANISDTYSWAYQDVALGRFAGPLEAALKDLVGSGYNDAKSIFSGGDFFGSLKDGALSAYSALKSAISSKNLGIDGKAFYSNAVGLGGQALGASAGAESVFIGAANPYLRNTFSGVGFKEWSFQFLMMARNKKDSDAIKNIVNFFEFYGTPSTDGAILDNRYTFKIKFIAGNNPTIPGVSGQASAPSNLSTNGTTSINAAGGAETALNSITVSATRPSHEDPYMPKIEDCVLTGCQTQYNSLGVSAFHADGSPIDVLITLSFREVAIRAHDLTNSTQSGPSSPGNVNLSTSASLAQGNQIP